jgi:hypothetical protein
MTPMSAQSHHSRLKTSLHPALTENTIFVLALSRMTVMLLPSDINSSKQHLPTLSVK